MKRTVKFLLDVVILVVYDILLDGSGVGIKERWKRFMTWVKK